MGRIFSKGEKTVAGTTSQGCSGWASGPQKDMSKPLPPRPVTVSLSGRRVFADLIKLRIFR